MTLAARRPGGRNSGFIVTGRERPANSRGQGHLPSPRGFGFARRGPHMPSPHRRRPGADDAGMRSTNLAAINKPQTRSRNDVVFCAKPARSGRMNNFGCSLVWGTPGPDRDGAVIELSRAVCAARYGLSRLRPGRQRDGREVGGGRVRRAFPAALRAYSGEKFSGPHHPSSPDSAKPRIEGRATGFRLSRGNPCLAPDALGQHRVPERIWTT